LNNHQRYFCSKVARCVLPTEEGPTRPYSGMMIQIMAVYFTKLPMTQLKFQLGLYRISLECCYSFIAKKFKQEQGNYRFK